MHHVVFGVAFALAALSREPSAENTFNCSETAKYVANEVQGIELRLKSNHIERLSDYLPVTLVVRNKNPDPTAVLYEPLSGTLRFDVKDSKGECVSPHSALSTIDHEGRIAGGDERNIDVNLWQYAEIRQPGTYTVTAHLHAPISTASGQHQMADLVSNAITIVVVP